MEVEALVFFLFHKDQTVSVGIRLLLLSEPTTSDLSPCTRSDVCGEVSREVHDLSQGLHQLKGLWVLQEILQGRRD